MQNWGLSDKKTVANEIKKAKSVFQSYISSQQQGHHMALPDNGQLLLQQFLYLRNRAECWQSRAQRPIQEDVIPLIPTQPRSVHTQGMPEGAQPPPALQVPALSQSQPKPSQSLPAASTPAASPLARKMFRNGTVGHHLFNSYSIASRD